MQKTHCDLEEIKLIGITIRTRNQDEFNPDAAKIPACIMKYFYGGLSDQIPNRKNPGVTVCAYTDYETDHLGPYTYFIGEKVSSIDTVPEGFETLIIPPQAYIKFTTAPGPMPSVVINAWTHIWALPSEDLGGIRRYHTDFEMYDERAMDPQNSIVDVYIGVR